MTVNANPTRAPTPRRWPRQAGFTLVEVLVALLIMAILSALAWQGLDGMLRAREASARVLEDTQRLNTVLTQWEQDLRALHDTEVAPSIAFDGRQLRLTRRSEGGVQLVVWALHGDAWQRWASPVMQRAGELQQAWLASQQLQGREAGQLVLAREVGDWELYYFRGNAWTNAQSSGELAAPGAGPPAPVAPGAAGPAPAALRELAPDGVRLVLTLGGQTLTRDIALGPGE